VSSERQARLNRWYGLLSERDGSEAYRLRGRIRLFSVSFRTFEANYRELLASLAAIRPQAIPEDLGMPIDDSGSGLQLEAICRCLHNYLAAAGSLIDHMRVLHREIYQPAALIPRYQAEINERFVNNGLAQLVKSLRNVNMHCHQLIITYSERVNIDRNGASIASEVYIRKDAILAHGNLPASARTFLVEMGDRISLEAIIERYHDAMVDFYDWFSARQQEIHGEAFRNLERIEQELREIKAAEKEYFEGLGAVQK
jgi:hypothetical protein